jgi:hypothetical protein
LRRGKWVKPGYCEPGSVIRQIPSSINTSGAIAK